MADDDMSDGQIPGCFLPMKSSRKVLKYRNLSKHVFKPGEKTFLCREMNQETALLAPTWVSKDGSNEHRTSRGFAVRYRVHRQTLDGWMNNHKNNLPQDRHGGKPHALDEQSKEMIRERIKAGQISTKTVLKSELIPMIAEEKKKTMIRRGKRVLPEEVVGVSPSYAYKLRKSENIKFRVAQDLTEARRAALSDVRIFYRVSCMFDAFSGHLPGAMKWNADATTAIVKETNTGALVCMIDDKKKDAQGKRQRVKLDSSRLPGSTNLLVKWMLLCSAAGNTGPLTLIVAIDGMREEDYFATQVTGMAASSELGAQPGWLYFCRTRAGNAALWRHWFQFVLIPTLQKCRELYADLFTHGMQDLFFSTDGEAIILNEAFDSHIQSLFKLYCIIYGKNGPSVTSKVQAADAGDTFRDYKTGLEYVTVNGVDTSNDLLRICVEGAFTEFTGEFPSVEFSSLVRKKIACAIEKIVYVMRAKYVTPEKITQGFVRTGQHVMNAAPGQSTVNYDRIMSLTLAEGITTEEMDHMRAMRPQVIEEFKLHGRVTSSFLDNLGIVRSPEAEDRDELTLCRQDCQILTHADTVQRFKDSHVQPMALYASPLPTVSASGVEISAAERKAAEKKLLAEEKRVAAAAAKATAKEEEAARKALLTPAERKEEAAALRDAKAAKKATKAAEAAATLARARETLGLAT